MAWIYLINIQRGEMTLDDVPAHRRVAVEALMAQESE